MQQGGPQYRGGDGSPGGLGLGNAQVINIDIIVGIANIILLIILLYMYLRSYRDFKSKFTLGLLSFATLLLLQNIIFIAFLLTSQGFRGPGMGTPIFVLNIIEFFALIMLVWVTRE